MSSIVSHDEAMKVLEKLRKEAGSQLNLAKKLDFSPSYINDVFLGRKAISDNLAKKIGFRRVIGFVKSEKV